jgi:ribosome-binding protein aMBF1 (putative translation factor)
MTTPLASYMDREGINDADFAPRIGRDRSMVNKLRRGRARPTLELAAMIERETGGEVPMASWVGAEAA